MGGRTPGLGGTERPVERLDLLRMEEQGKHEFAGRGIPKPCRLIIAGCDDDGAIRAEAGALDLLLMSEWPQEMLAGCDVPDLRRAIATGGEQPAAKSTSQ